MAQVSPSSPLPEPSKALRVAEALRAAIRGGELAIGEQLPSTRHLAKRFGTSLNTLQVALRLLQSEGLIAASPRRRGVVLGDPAPGAPLKRGGSQVLLVRPLQRDEDPHLTTTGHVIPGVEAAISEAGLHLTLDAFEPGAAAPHEQVLRTADRLGEALAGVIFFAFRLGDALIAGLEARGLPWVQIGRRRDDPPEGVVAVDLLEGGRRMGSLLAAAGVRRLLLLQQVHDRSAGLSDQASGLLRGALESGQPLQCHILPEPDWHEEAGYQRVTDYLRTAAEPPEVIYADSDFCALGALRALRDAGIAVPETTGVIGGAGLSVSRFSHPTLTVIEQPFEALGRAAGQMLLRRRAGASAPLERLACEPVLRASLRLATPT